MAVGGAGRRAPRDRHRRRCATLASVGVVAGRAWWPWRCRSCAARRRRAAGQRELVEARTRPGGGDDRHRPGTGAERRRRRRSSRPSLDLVAPVIGVVGLVAAGAATPAAPAWLAVARFLVGAAFLGAVTDAMLLGHWYLVQPGLARGPLLELVQLAGVALAVRGGCCCWCPTGMVSVLNGTIDDGYAACWAGSGWPARSPRSGSAGHHPPGPEGARVLGRDGRHRPALPGHPHRLRHRSGGPGATVVTS